MPLPLINSTTNFYLSLTMARINGHFIICVTKTVFPLYDLIWKGIEITTGAQREHRYAQLETQAREKGLSADVNFEICGINCSISNASVVLFSDFVY